MSDRYKLILKSGEDSRDRLRAGDYLKVSSNRDDAETISLVIKDVKGYPSGVGLLLKDIKKLIRALKLPFASRSAWQRISAAIFTYLILLPSGISSFFVRGWRFRIIKNMIEVPRLGIGPELTNIYQVGDDVKIGIKLVATRLLYEAPKILILVIAGYSLVELALDWVVFFVQRFFKPDSVPTIAIQWSETLTDLSISMIFSVVLVVIYSVIVTPAYKILEIRYAAGVMEYDGFFKLKNIKNSFLLYRKYRFKTLQVYIYDLIVSTVGLIMSIFALVLLPVLGFFIGPVYRLIFVHWPKSYGYGTLARRMHANGDLVIEK